MLRVVTCCLLLASVPAGASAQQGPLWERGVSLRAAGQDAEALSVFEQAHAQDGTSATLAQVALAEQALGRWGAAGQHLDEALARPDSWVTQNQSVLQAARAEIARHTGTLQVTVDHAGARIVVNGREVGRSPLGPVPVTAGQAQVRVERNGAVVDRSVTIAAGQVAQESITLGPGAGGGGGGGALTVVGAILLGLGGGAAIGMGVSLGVRESSAAEYNGDPCWPAGATRDEQCGHLRSTVEQTEIAAIALGAGAAVLAGVGVALVAVGAGSGGGSAEVRCGVLPAGVSCRGRF